MSIFDQLNQNLNPFWNEQTQITWIICKKLERLLINHEIAEKRSEKTLPNLTSHNII